MQVLGVMSGSSLDGLDLALVSFMGDPLEWKMLGSSTVSFPQKLANNLKSAHTSTVKDLMEVEYQLTQFISDAITGFQNSHSIKPNLISVHGHTLWHRPELHRSWQLLNGGMLAEACACDVICDFRNQDMSLGGQGTPMAVLADRDLFPGYDHYVNLGGIANISSLSESTQAYDLCPCNQLLNTFANEEGLKYDDKGKLARKGTISTELLEWFFTDPYLNQAPPKSLDNSHSRILIKEINQRFELSTADKLRTTVEYIAQVITEACTNRKAQILITGGGGYNDFLMERIQTLIQSSGSTIVKPA